MRILFVTTHKHIPELRGGMEINTHELVKEFAARGHSAGVLCGLAGTGFVGLKARLRIKFVRESAPRDDVNGYPVWRSYNAVRAVEAVAKSFQPDLIVVQGGADFNDLMRASLKLCLPVVCYLHTADRLLLPDDIAGHPRLRFVANSEFTKSIHPEKAIDSVFRPIMRQSEYAVETDRSSVIFINPSQHKGLGVVTGLARARPDVPFLFVVNRRLTTPQQQEAGLPTLPNIRYIGPFADMRKVYGRARLVLAPSQCLETWGRVASEAHYSGIPVLASNNGGLTEAVGPGGLCLPANAPPEEWASAFSAIWDDAARYEQFVQHAMHYSRREEIDPRRIASSMLDYFESRIEEAQSPPEPFAFQDISPGAAWSKAGTISPDRF